VPASGAPLIAHGEIEEQEVVTDIVIVVSGLAEAQRILGLGEL